jgi:putative colanic acid biosynthesis UDP-glucose lipid carrier transferase
MTRRAVNLLELCLSLAHTANPLLAFALAALLRFRSGYFSPVRGESPVNYVLWVAVMTLVWMIVVKELRLNRVSTISTFNTGIKMTATAMSYTTAVVLAMFFFYRQIQFPRVFVLSGIFLMFLFSVLVLYSFRKFALARRGPFKQPLKIAILGSDEYAIQVTRHLESHPLLPVEVVCFIASHDSAPRLDARPLVSPHCLEDLTDKYGCKEVVVALPISRFAELSVLLEQLRSLCIPVRVVLDIASGFFVPDRLFDFYGLPLLDVRPNPFDTISYAVGKRIFDILFSILVLTVTSPLSILVALAIKLTSPGPIIFSQERISLNGKPFKMQKFRTMHIQYDTNCDTAHTSRNDRRVTPIGKLLRRYSLDELPQFINVLKGDMSVVGPRPELTFFVKKFRHEIPDYMARHNVKCGITGLAQISGFRGSDTCMNGRIEQDLVYLQNWSMYLDLKIVLQTLFKGFVGRNAY